MLVKEKVWPGRRQPEHIAELRKTSSRCRVCKFGRGEGVAD